MDRFMLAVLTRALERRHPWTEGHAERVASLALAVARSLDWEQHQLAAVQVGALLHDVGKLALDSDLLGKPGPLTPAERARVQTHPLEGARLVDGLPDVGRALPCVLYHHERWDGRGYPTRLIGDAIPLDARLVAIADAFDAMTSVRPYRGAMSVEGALTEIVRCAGTQFDPVLARAAVEVWATQHARQRVAV
jgi:HD-GYP domain-containing protein (c-di-GMP phosphodiesterase class II)